MDDAYADRLDDRPATDLSGSARGWHRVQLAVLAFIGLCGVLGDIDADAPDWLEITAIVLALLALVLACVAIFLVAGVAWPVSLAQHAEGAPDARAAATATRRLRLGVALTYVAVGLMALAASTNWWPADASVTVEGGLGANVEITDGSGRTACGEMVDGPQGWIRLATDSGTVELRLGELAAITPVGAC